MLEAVNISKFYGKQSVLKNFNFLFESASIYGIIGPNGAGKSTLLRILGAFEESDQGEVFLQGQRLSQPSPLISCMWQKPYLFQTTVEKNVAYGLKIRGFTGGELSSKTDEILTRFRLESLKAKNGRLLSGGEGARVALARTIACGSPIILLDEPAANLDPPNTRMIEELIKDIQKEKGLTVIVVTHDMFQARRLADYTLFIDRGELIEWNKTKELFDSPQKNATQRFLQGIL